MLRQAIQRICTRWLDATGTPLDMDALKSDAVVLAPHPDDETLGCGGTIRLKRAAGARVWIVFMTDGARSHAARIDRCQLSAEREREALEACAILGVPESDVVFLRFPDGRLADHHDAAVGGIVRILQAVRCGQLLVPYRHDGTADHEATFRIAREAIRRAGLAGTPMLEYAVWAWGRWPWVAAHCGPACLRTWVPAVSAAWRLVTRFGLYTDVTSVLDDKRRALDAHRTQMQRRDGDPEWVILSDVHDGEFLRRVLGPRELFSARATHQWTSPGTQPG